jgi:hypothetical protein
MATAIYNTPEKKTAFHTNVADLVADGFSVKAAILSQAAIDLFCSNLLANAEYLEGTAKSGNLDLSMICRIADMAAAEAARATAGL